MARQPDIQYVQFYTAGSAARKIEVQRQPQKSASAPQVQTRPGVRRRRRKIIRIDPIAVCAMAVAAFLLITMAIGMIELGSVNDEAARMDSYVTQLQAENAQLRTEYQSGYDLDDIEEKALEMGLVPESQVEHITIRVEHPKPEPEPTAWDEFVLFLTGLFA